MITDLLLCCLLGEFRGEAVRRVGERAADRGVLWDLTNIVLRYQYPLASL